MFIFDHGWQETIQISTFTVLHHQGYPHRRLVEHVFVLHNMIALELSKDVDFLGQLMLLLGVHSRIANFLADQQSIVSATAHLEHLAVLAPANTLQNLVAFHNLNINRYNELLVKFKNGDNNNFWRPISRGDTANLNHGSPFIPVNNLTKSLMYQVHVQF